VISFGNEILIHEMAQNFNKNKDKSLLSIYEEDIQLNSIAEKSFNTLIKSITRRLIEKMKQESNAFAELFADVYHENLDYTQRKGSEPSQNIDLNLFLEIKGTNVEICGLGSKTQFPHLGFVKVLWPSIASMKISCNANDGYIYLSPNKIFDLIQTACDSALSRISNRMIVHGKEYIINRSDNAKKPFTIIVNESGACHNNISNLIVLIDDPQSNVDMEFRDLNNNPQFTPINCKIDMIPAIKLDFSYLPQNEGKWGRVNLLRSQFSCLHVRTFEVIPLKLNSGKPRFRISFLRIEKEIFKEHGCFEEVTKLFKLSKKLCFPLLDWYTLKAVIMWFVIERRCIKGYWKTENLEICFIDIMNELLSRLDKAWIPDIFFTKFNRMGTLLGHRYYASIDDGKNFELHQIKHLANTIKKLHSKLYAYQRGNTQVSTFFSKD